MIQQAALHTSPHKELMKDGDLDWDLVELLYSIFSKVSEQTDVHESLTATSGHQIQSYFDLLEFTLDADSPSTPKYVY